GVLGLQFSYDGVVLFLSDLDAFSVLDEGGHGCLLSRVERAEGILDSCRWSGLAHNPPLMKMGGVVYAGGLDNVDADHLALLGPESIPSSSGTPMPGAV